MVIDRAVDSESLAKIEQRIGKLNSIVAHIEKLELALSRLLVLSKPRQMQQLTLCINATQKLLTAKVPVGSKRPLVYCMNELQSIKEGLFLGAKVDAKSMSMLTASEARAKVQELIEISSNRLKMNQAIASNEDTLEQFYKEAETVIKKNDEQASKVKTIANKPYAIVRVPVVPTDVNINSSKLSDLGFKVDNLSGYAVLHNQLVVGINPKFMVDAKGHKISSGAELYKEAQRILKMLRASTKKKYMFVSESAFRYQSSSWYWIMTQREIDNLAKAITNHQVDISRWGFAFNG